jgi:hypothetical protein
MPGGVAGGLPLWVPQATVPLAYRYWLYPREKGYSGSYHSQSFCVNCIFSMSYYCTVPPLDFDRLNDIHDSFSNTSSPQSTNPSFLLSILIKLSICLFCCHLHFKIPFSKSCQQRMVVTPSFTWRQFYNPYARRQAAVVPGAAIALTTRPVVNDDNRNMGIQSQNCDGSIKACKK